MDNYFRDFRWDILFFRFLFPAMTVGNLLRLKLYYDTDAALNRVDNPRVKVLWTEGAVFLLEMVILSVRVTILDSS